MKVMIGILLLLSFSVYAEEDDPQLQDRFERSLIFGLHAQDDFVNYSEPAHVPLRYRNSYTDCSNFVDAVGWSTNRFLDGLARAFTNNQPRAGYGLAETAEIRRRGLLLIGDLPIPSATNLLSSFLKNEDMHDYHHLMITPLFQRTNLEQAVLDRVCECMADTNMYAKISSEVLVDMQETLRTMPDEGKAAASNRVARFMYHSLRHTNRALSWQDDELVKFLPAYSNSIQRLSAMRHVSDSAIVPKARGRALNEVSRLLQIGTNNLTNIEWLEDGRAFE